MSFSLIITRSSATINNENQSYSQQKKNFIESNIKKVINKNRKADVIGKKRGIAEVGPTKGNVGRKRAALGDISNAIPVATRTTLMQKKAKMEKNVQLTKPVQVSKPKLKISKSTTNLRGISKKSSTTNKVTILTDRNNKSEMDSKVSTYDNEINAGLPSSAVECSMLTSDIDEKKPMEQDVKEETLMEHSDVKEEMVVEHLDVKEETIENKTEVGENICMIDQSDAEITFKKDEMIKDKVFKLNEINLPDGVKPFDLDPEVFSVSEYAASIFNNMKIRERKYPVKNYMSETSQTTPNNRAILVDWLVEVQENFELYHETLYLAVKIVDYYLQNNETPKELLQLVGATSLLIACKLEERHPPPIDDFQFICDDAFSHQQFIETELKIFKALDFDINLPISYRFLRRFSRVTSMSMEILTLARYLLELSLQSSIFVHEFPSKMAATCLCLALKMKDECPWDINFTYHTGYEEKELIDLMKKLNEIVKDAPESKLQTVRSKYSHPVFHQVAKTKPLDSIDL